MARAGPQGAVTAQGAVLPEVGCPPELPTPTQPTA